MSLQEKWLRQCVHDVLQYVGSHPFTQSRVLIQLGYEPLLPQKVYTCKAFFFWNEDTWYSYPNTLHYMRSIVSDIGLSGLFFTGFAARFTQIIIHQALYGALENYLEQQYSDAHDGRRTKQSSVLHYVGFRLAAHVPIYAILYPLRCAMIRQIATLVNKEPPLGNFISVIIKAVSEEGIASIFRGLTPKLIEEAALCACVALTAYYVEKLMKHNEPPVMEDVVHAATGMLFGGMTYRFSVISTIMAVDRPCPIYGRMSFGDIYSYLYNRGDLNRGGMLLGSRWLCRADNYALKERLSEQH